MAAPEQVTDLRIEQALRAWTQRHSGSWKADDEANLQKWLAASC